MRQAQQTSDPTRHIVRRTQQSHLSRLTSNTPKGGTNYIKAPH